MKRLKVISGLLLVVTLLALVACAPQPTTTPAPRPTPTPTPTPTPAPVPAPKILLPDEGVSYGTLLPATGDRMIVRSGDMLLVVADVVVARDRIAQLAVTTGGYVVSSWVSGEKEGTRGGISMRVPDEKFEPTLVELRKLAIRVNSESTNSQDVTEQYIDLEARLKNAQATESQYLALLSKATTVEDTLKIYDGLARIRGEIEQIKGQMQYLERTSSMSQITVQLQPVASTEPLVPISWNALEVLKSAIRGLVTFGQWLVTGAIWLLILLPVWGAVLGVFFWYRRRGKAQ